MKCLKAFGIISIVLVVIATLYLVAGGYNVAADDPHWRATALLLTAVRERSIASRASPIVAPPDLNTAKRVADGAVDYAEMCAGCHLAPGIKNTELREGLYPTPPDLAHDPVSDPKVAFWTIKHGIKMTGMPAWGKSHNDELIWNMVAFLRKLPDTTPERYRALTAKARPDEHGHDDDPMRQ